MTKSSFEKVVLGYMTILSLASGGLISAPAQTNFTILRSFTQSPDGAIGSGPVVVDSNNVLYGGTLAGVSISNFGTIFRVQPDGTEYQVIHLFDSAHGSEPYAGVIVASDGNLYGTTYIGGQSNLGTIFSLGRDGSNFNVLHSFIGTTDGAKPESALIEGSDGVIYGTTYATTTSRGTVFKINKSGTGYAILHSFTGNPDGQNPASRLLEASDGMLYGTTVFGGTSVAGTIYSLAKDGSDYSTLYSFHNSSGDGVEPQAGLIEGSDHLLYGVAYQGGTNSTGTVYKINKGGTGYATIFSFLNTGSTGARPNAELTEGPDGALYGGTDYNTAQPYNGELYKINKDGTGYMILRYFLTNGDGATPRCSLTLLSNGVFYGTTEHGGTGVGCVFALSTNSLPPRTLSLSMSATSNVIQFAATSGITYDVLRSTNLPMWSTQATVTAYTNGQLLYSDPSPPTNAAFYELKNH